MFHQEAHTPIRGVLFIVALFIFGCLATSGRAREWSVTPDNIDYVLSGASPGDLLNLSPGDYSGPLVIDTPLILSGSHESIIHGHSQGHVLEIRADNVTVEGLSIRGSARNLSKDHAGVHVTGDQVTIQDNLLENNLHGIYVKGGSGIKIIGNQVRRGRAGKGGESGTSGMHHDHGSVRENRGNGIHFWRSENNIVRGNRVRTVRDGIYFSFTNNSRVENNRVSNVRYGLHYMYSDKNTFTGNRFSHSVAGAAIMFSKELTVTGNHFVENRGFRAFGLLLQDVDRSQFKDNIFTGNRIGTIMRNSFQNRFVGNKWQMNRTGIRLASSARQNRFHENRMGPNRRDLEFSGIPPENVWSHEGRGNYWYEYQGVDLTGNGVGLLPHNEVDVLARARGNFAYVDLLAESPLVSLMEWMFQRVPLPGTHYITDPHPLVNKGGHPRG